MAIDDSSLMDEVRILTDYEEFVLPDGDLKEIISIAKREIRERAPLPADYNAWYTNSTVESALFWTTCLFCKVKSGELDGVDMSLGDMDIDSIRAAGQSYGDEATVWYRNSHRYIEQIKPRGGYGIRDVSRPNRTYGYGNTQEGGGTGGL